MKIDLENMNNGKEMQIDKSGKTASFLPFLSARAMRAVEGNFFLAPEIFSDDQ